MDKKILKQKVKINGEREGLKFQLKLRYYPEDVVKELHEHLALRLLFKQVRCPFS